MFGKDYNNLYTIDVVCHGVPSNKVYKKFIENLERKKKNKVRNIRWRDKIKGWGPNRITIFFEDGEKNTTTSRQNRFQTGFLNNLYLRNSCYQCRYARLPRISDISLADFWGYDGKLLDENKNKGISAVIISTKKGQDIFNEIKENLTYHGVEENYLTSRSRHVYLHPEENTQRDYFFKDLDKMSFNRLSKKYKMKNSETLFYINRLKAKIKKLKERTK